MKANGEGRQEGELWGGRRGGERRGWAVDGRRYSVLSLDAAADFRASQPVVVKPERTWLSSTSRPVYLKTSSLSRVHLWPSGCRWRDLSRKQRHRRRYETRVEGAQVKGRTKKSWRRRWRSTGRIRQMENEEEEKEDADVAEEEEEKMVEGE